MIDLGYEVEMYMPEVEGEPASKKRYPSFHVRQDGEAKLPGKVGEELVVKVKLRKVAGEMRETEDGKKVTECTYEVRELGDNSPPKTFNEQLDEYAGG